MNEAIFILVCCVVIFLVYLLPLWMVCKVAQDQRKNYRIVLLVGLLTSWLVALIVMLVLPTLTDAEVEALKWREKKGPRPEGTLGDEAMRVILWTLGAMSLVMMAAIIFAKLLGSGI